MLFINLYFFMKSVFKTYIVNRVIRYLFDYLSANIHKTKQKRYSCIANKAKIDNFQCFAPIIHCIFISIYDNIQWLRITAFNNFSNVESSRIKSLKNAQPIFPMLLLYVDERCRTLPITTISNSLLAQLILVVANKQKRKNPTQ